MPREKVSIKKNLIYNIVFQVLRVVLPIITMPYVSRIMGAEKIGIYSYSYSVATYFGLFILLGLQSYGNRTIASVRDDEEKTNTAFWSIYKMQLLMAFVIIPLYILYSLTIAQEKNMALIQIIYLISVGLDISWYFFGVERFDITVTKSIIIKLISVAAIFLFVHNEESLYLYAVILAMSSLINELVLWLELRKTIKYKKVTKRQIVGHIKPNLILFIPIVAISIYTMMDKIMIGLLSNMDEVGFYENASQISRVAIIIVSPLGTVMLPRISNLVAKKKKEQILKYLNKSLIVEAFISSALAFGILSISDKFVPVFFGDSFDKCSIVMPILSMSTIFIAWANIIRSQYLIPYKKDKVYIISVTLGAITNLILNSLLIPRHGSIGAAIGTLCSEAIVSLTQTVLIRKEINILTSIKKCVVFWGIGMIMSLININLISGRSDISTIIERIIAGSVVYLALSYLYVKIILKKNPTTFIKNQ